MSARTIFSNEVVLDYSSMEKEEDLISKDRKALGIKSRRYTAFYPKHKEDNSAGSLCDHGDNFRSSQCNLYNKFPSHTSKFKYISLKIVIRRGVYGHL